MLRLNVNLQQLLRKRFAFDRRFYAHLSTTLMAQPSYKDEGNFNIILVKVIVIFFCETLGAVMNHYDSLSHLLKLLSY